MGQSTLDKLLKWAEDQLSSVSDTSNLDARILVQYVTGRSHAQLIAHNGDTLSEKEMGAVREIIIKRRQGTPVAYLTGKREFWSMDFKVSPATLIPRPETELLVEQALARIPADKTTTVADIGTGCGAIALSIAKERPDVKIIATDISAEALNIAQLNGERLGLQNIEYRSGDLLSALEDSCCEVIVSNPPYVCENDSHLDEGDVTFEPRSALVSGPDGLDAIRNIVRDAKQKLKQQGWLLVEHGYNQADQITTMMASAGFDNIRTYRDLAGLERVTECQSR